MAVRLHMQNASGSPLCRKVPGWAAMTTMPREVTCRYCLRLLAARSLKED